MSSLPWTLPIAYILVCMLGMTFAESIPGARDLVSNPGIRMTSQSVGTSNTPTTLDDFQDVLVSLFVRHLMLSDEIRSIKSTSSLVAKVSRLTTYAAANSNACVHSNQTSGSSWTPGLRIYGSTRLEETYRRPKRPRSSFPRRTGQATYPGTLPLRSWRSEALRSRTKIAVPDSSLRYKVLIGCLLSLFATYKGMQDLCMGRK